MMPHKKAGRVENSEIVSECASCGEVIRLDLPERGLPSRVDVWCSKCRRVTSIILQEVTHK